LGICYIVGAGNCENITIDPSPEDYIIAADNGYSYLKSLEIKPDVLIGDFDSLEIVPASENIIRHPVEKDETDMMLAMKAGLDLGYQRFVIYGGLGGRLDHTYANIQMLVYLSAKGARGYLIDGTRIVTAITNEELVFKTDKKGILSVFCGGDKAVGVNLKGLKYELVDAVLTKDFPLGVSNEFMGYGCSVSVEKGSLIIMWSDSSFNIDDII